MTVKQLTVILYCWLALLVIAGFIFKPTSPRGGLEIDPTVQYQILKWLGQ